MNKSAEKTRSTVSFNTTIFINFSNEDFEVMTHFLKHGYSEMGKHVGVGGFWYGYTNRREWLDSNKIEQEDDEAYNLELTFRQVDTLLKALEVRGLIHNRKYLHRADRLAIFLYKILSESNEQTKLAREQFQKTLTIE